MVFRLILQSGQRGIDLGSIGSKIDLPRHLLDSVIQALVDFGKVAVSMEAGKRIYRPA